MQLCLLPQAKKWAVEFLKLLCDPDVQKDFLSGVSQMPTLKDLYADEELVGEFPILEMAYPQYEFAHFRPILVQYQEWSTMVQEALHEVMANGAEPQDVWRTAAEGDKSRSRSKERLRGRPG